MKTAAGIAWVGLLAMTAGIVFAVLRGNLAEEGAWLAAHPWGLMSLIDLYTGFVLFSMWIAYRETSLPRIAGWVVLMMVLGNWTAALYVLLALHGSRGDWRVFWQGPRRATE